ncbi:MAG: hypothetical protein GKR89_37770 [Candidatus Latescibacteria bacterium]|nr:hypothetical protein [Candidatus Latescibacterota bacterium]
MADRLGGHAAVIGGSIAGMMAARVLSDFFDAVTILERDPISGPPAHRKSVSQDRHYHVLLQGGEGVLSALFPGFTADLDHCGAVRVRAGTEIGCFFPDGKAYTALGTVREPVDLGADIFSLSRPALEACVRQRIGGLASVRWFDGVSVQRPIAVGQRLEGLEYKRDGQVETIEADFIVDTSGRGCRAPKWLAELGYAAPATTEMGIDFAYSTTRYRIPKELWGDEKIKIIIGPPPDYSDYGFAALIEDDIWMVCMAGCFGHYPPADEAGFAAFARALHDPTLAQMMAGGQRISDIHTYRFPTSLWRHYEGLERFPDGYVVLGDAIASFNPVYGQGMSSAANQVMALQRMLQQRASENAGLDALAKPFFAEMARVVETPWGLTAGRDLAFPDTVGERPADFAEGSQYFAALAALLPGDRELYRQVNEVFHLARPLADLFADPIRARVEAKLREAA